MANVIHEASAEELQTLPGIGPKLAERIVANRPYRKVDDLLKVRGIGTNNLERFRAWTEFRAALSLFRASTFSA